MWGKLPAIWTAGHAGPSRRHFEHLATTAAGEPAWHRRARRDRQRARGVLAVARARQLLADHHGGGGGGAMPHGSKRLYWVCPCGKWTWASASTTSCFGCGQAPSSATRQWLESQGCIVGGGRSACTRHGARNAWGEAPTQVVDLEGFATVGKSKKQRRAARRTAAALAAGAGSQADDSAKALVAGPPVVAPSGGADAAATADADMAADAIDPECLQARLDALDKLGDSMATQLGIDVSAKRANLEVAMAESRAQRQAAKPLHIRELIAQRVVGR